MCARQTAETRAECASYNAEQAFRNAVALFDDYQAIRLTVRNRDQVTTRARINALQTAKQRALGTLTTRLRTAINTGVPEYLAGATFYLGLAQWEYGSYLKNAQLPATGFTDEERAATVAGFNTLAEAEYARARETWQALLNKAQQEPALANDPGASRWLQMARDAIAGNVPSSPPPPAGEDAR
jgi:hypothetical protein